MAGEVKTAAAILHEALSASPVAVSPAGPRQCQCVKDHAPTDVVTEGHHIWPLGWGGPNTRENMIWLCGSAHNNVHALMRAYAKYGRTDLRGTIEAPLLRRVNAHVRELAIQGWTAYQSSLHLPDVPSLDEVRLREGIRAA